MPQFEAPLLAATLAAALVVGGCQSVRRSAPEPAPPRVEPGPSGESSTREPRPRRSAPPQLWEIEARPFPTSLPIPVDGVRPEELSSSFDAPRSGGRRHHAIDIFAPRDTPVRSATDGYVTRRRVLGLGGKTLSIVGPGGSRHYYAHLEDWAEVEVGDYVAEGTIIGFVGNSGNARGGPTHLHYAIYRPWGDAIDPYPLLVD